MVKYADLLRCLRTPSHALGRVTRSIIEWNLARQCDRIYRVVRLDFLRISILTGNIGEIWIHDEFALGFLITRVTMAMEERATFVTPSQKPNMVLSVVSRLLGSSRADATAACQLEHGLRFEDGEAFARRLASGRASAVWRSGPHSTTPERALAFYGACCVRMNVT